MCQHSDDDSDCLSCCYLSGREDAEDGEPCGPPYKNWDQCNAYRDGYYSRQHADDRTRVAMLEEKLHQYRQRLKAIEKEESEDYSRYAESAPHLSIATKAYWRLDAIKKCLMLLDNIFGQHTAEHADEGEK